MRSFAFAVHVGRALLPVLHSASPPSAAPSALACFPTSAITGGGTAIASATTRAPLGRERHRTHQQIEVRYHDTQHALRHRTHQPPPLVTSQKLIHNHPPSARCSRRRPQRRHVPFQKIGTLHQAVVFLHAPRELVDLLLHHGPRARVRRQHPGQRHSA